MNERQGEHNSKTKKNNDRNTFMYTIAHNEQYQIQLLS